MQLWNCEQGEQLGVGDDYIVTVVEVRGDEVVLAISKSNGQPVEARAEPTCLTDRFACSAPQRDLPARFPQFQDSYSG